MASIKDTFQDHPDPPKIGGWSAKCGNCLHFRNVPQFKVGGARATCASNLIGRSADQTPCVHYAIDTLSYLSLPRDLRDAVVALIRQIEESPDLPAGIDAHLAIVGALVEAGRLRKRGRLRLGVEYGYTFSGKAEVGTLIGLRDGAALMLTKGVVFHAELRSLTTIPGGRSKRAKA